MRNFFAGIFVTVAVIVGFDLYAPKIITGVCCGGRDNNPVIEMPRVTITNFDGPGNIKKPPKVCAYYDNIGKEGIQ